MLHNIKVLEIGAITNAILTFMSTSIDTYKLKGVIKPNQEVTLKLILTMYSELIKGWLTATTSISSLNDVILNTNLPILSKPENFKEKQ